MDTSPSLSQKKLQEARVNVYKTNRHWSLGMIADSGRRPKARRNLFCAQQREPLINPPAENISKLYLTSNVHKTANAVAMAGTIVADDHNVIIYFY